MDVKRFVFLMKTPLLCQLNLILILFLMRNKPTTGKTVAYNYIFIRPLYKLHIFPLIL